MNMNMSLDFGDYLVFISIIATLGIFLYMRKVLPESRYKKTFLWLFPLLAAYTNWKLFLHPDDMLSNFGIFDMWFRHAFFYTGQWFLLVFFALLFESVAADSSNARSRSDYFRVFLPGLLLILIPTVIITLAVMNLKDVAFTLYNFIYFVTDYGIQHILALLFFFSTMAYVRSFALYPEYRTVKNFLQWFAAANFFFIMLHLFEYTSETLHLFPWLSDATGENLEAVFQYAALFLTAVSAYKLSGIKTSEHH